MAPCSVTATRTPWESRCARSGRKSSVSLACSISRFCAASAKAFSPRIIRGGSTVTASPKTRGSRSATARSRMGRHPTVSAACLPPPSRPPSACETKKRCTCSPIGLNRRSGSAPANAIVSGKSRRIYSALRTSTAISSASIPHGQTCSAGPRRKSNRCMSTNCDIPTILRPPLPRVQISREVRKTCASKTVSAIATERGDGSPGP